MVGGHSKGEEEAEERPVQVAEGAKFVGREWGLTGERRDNGREADQHQLCVLPFL